MSRDQIEEIAWLIDEAYDNAEMTGSELHGYEVATHIYNAGYRKQEWISVDERLPEREGHYLTSTIKGVIMIGAFFSYYGSSYNPQFKYDVTHWMPLPEAPKMKGGEE